MKKLNTFFNNYMLSFLFIAWIAMNLWMYYGVGGMSDISRVSEGHSLPDLSLSQNIVQLKTLMTDYGSQGRLYYIKYQFRDFIYPLVYGALLMGILYRLIKPISFNVWVFVPWIAVFFDYIENYFLRISFYDYPNLVPYKVQIASLASSLKWFFIFFSFLLIIIAYFNRRRRYINKHKVNNPPNTYVNS